MRLAKKYTIPIFVAAFALTFALATPYVVAEMGEKKHGHMIEKMNAYCSMSPEEQAEAIAKHHKSEEMVSKMNEYCSLDEEGQKATIIAKRMPLLITNVRFTFFHFLFFALASNLVPIAAPKVIPMPTPMASQKPTSSIIVP